MNPIAENALFAAGPLLALLAASQGLRTWLKFEIASSLLIAALLLAYPQSIFSLIMSVPLKSYHLFLCALLASYLIYSVLAPLFLLDSQDEAVFAGHLWARVVANTLIVLDNVYTYSSSFHWNYKLLCLSTSFAIFSLVISGYFYFTTKKPRSQSQFHDVVNHVAKIESYMVLSAGLLLYAFPDFAMLGLLGSSETYRSLCRTCGALLFSFSFESSAVSEFVYLKDKKTFMLTRLIGSIAELGAILLGFYYFKVFAPLPALALFLAVNMSYNFLVSYGYLVTHDIRVKHS